MAFDPTQAEGIGQDTLEESSSLPIIRIIQDQAPELKSRDEKYIEDAEAGDLLFNADKSILKRPLEFVPVGGTTVYVEWKPKAQGGGVVATHPLTIVRHPDYKKGVKTEHDEYLGENELKYTRYECILFLKDGEWVRALLAMTSTQLKVARKLSVDLAKFRYEGTTVVPPVFARKWKLDTVVEKNGSGQEYFNFKIHEPTVLDFTADEDLLNLAFECSKDARAELPAPSEAAQAALPAAGIDEEHGPF